ncbi:hypothetical protein AK812_SmicGene34481 [Symbiodinium microadriaticum]|uniref:Uncharacterized protein n=1 Tax=Symbiodinium microadriaticum TaxID=2951 RepID=A0A1Q9CNW2_SYMMI|nr:hypothetical protein AK812_SmicGene34481 [Symbiodinium microadriaticum]
MTVRSRDVQVRLRSVRQRQKQEVSLPPIHRRSRFCPKADRPQPCEPRFTPRLIPSPTSQSPQEGTLQSELSKAWSNPVCPQIMANMLDAGDKSRWPGLSVTLCSQTLIVADAGLEVSLPPIHRRSRICPKADRPQPCEPRFTPSLIPSPTSQSPQVAAQIMANMLDAGDKSRWPRLSVSQQQQQQEEEEEEEEEE